MKTILALDPGMNGALALYDGTELLTWRMPTYEITKNGGKRKKINIDELNETLDFCQSTGFIDMVYIEQVSAQPGNGAASAFTYGFGAGVLEAVIQCRKLPFTYILPQVWKKAMNCPANKDGARMRASQLFPQFSHMWKLKRDDGIAEASLISLYGFNKLITLHKNNS